MTPREGLESIKSAAISWQLSADKNVGMRECAAAIEHEIDALLSTADSEQRETVGMVEWVVNDNSELGVKIGDRFFWLYKGDSFVYENGKHDDGTPMLWRLVGKREFGECCHPVHLERYPERYTEGEGWKPLPPPVQPTRPAEQREVADLRAMLDRIAAIPDVADCFHAPSEENIADGVEGAIDDLRRKLEEANLENGRLLNDRKVFMQMLNESESERAAASLTIAALRQLLNDLAHCPKCHNCGDHFARVHNAALADLALPADSLVQEMVTVLRDARGMAHRHYIYDECQECGMLRGSIDALLARIVNKHE